MARTAGSIGQQIRSPAARENAPRLAGTLFLRNARGNDRERTKNELSALYELTGGGLFLLRRIF